MKTIETTIRHPERYEAPQMKIKTLRSRRYILALSVSGGTEPVTGDTGQTEDFGYNENGGF